MAPHDEESKKAKTRKKNHKPEKKENDTYENKINEDDC
jgi:hypothetical protein